MSREAALPARTEERLAAFAELVATAIANAQARADLRTNADEQAALRRVATLVADAARPPEVFAAVVEEAGRLLEAETTFLARYDADDNVTLVGVSSAIDDVSPIGSRWPVEERDVSALVRESGRPARIDHRDAPDAYGIRSAVAAPITVEGLLWGLMGIVSTSEDPVAPGLEARLAGFTDLVATAIANAQTRAELMASRARIVASADRTRRQMERDLHDGAQQRLVSLTLQLRAAQEMVPARHAELAAELEGAAAGLTKAMDELREFAHGIHPAILSERGLGPALKALRRRSAVPVELDVRTDGRLPERVEEAAYFVISEALANAAEHAGASAVAVEVEVADGALRISVQDDGVGGAGGPRGSGLVGLKDRVEALGGLFTVESPPGAGTSVRAELPLA
jgi:signal transduction histidine kinase